MDAKPIAIAALFIALLAGALALVRGAGPDEELELRVAELEAELAASREAPRASTATTSSHAGASASGVREPHRESGLEAHRPRRHAPEPRHSRRPAREVSSEAIVEALESEDPEVRARLAEVVRGEMETAHEERREERRERRRERSLSRLDELRDAAGLSESQHATLTVLLTGELDSIQDVFSEAHEDGSFGEAREKATEIRAESDEEASRVLDEDQYEAWSAMREEEEARRFGR